MAGAMNRSFRAPESQRKGRNPGSVMKEKDEELALFLEMRKREKERNSLLLLHSSDDCDPPLGNALFCAVLRTIETD